MLKYFLRSSIDFIFDAGSNTLIITKCLRISLSILLNPILKYISSKYLKAVERTLLLAFIPRLKRIWSDWGLKLGSICGELERIYSWAITINSEIFLSSFDDPICFFSLNLLP